MFVSLLFCMLHLNFGRFMKRKLTKVMLYSCNIHEGSNFIHSFITKIWNKSTKYLILYINKKYTELSLLKYDLKKTKLRISMKKKSGRCRGHWLCKSGILWRLGHTWHSSTGVHRAGTPPPPQRPHRSYRSSAPVTSGFPPLYL